MSKTPAAPRPLSALFGLQAENPIARMMAGFTGFAVAVTLILAMSIPVQAERKAPACAMVIDAVLSAPCRTVN
jgi:xanthine dehydrogenase iron-sulfur cluster and FAD-binding subunit A